MSFLSLLPRIATHSRLSSTLFTASTFPFTASVTWAYADPVRIKLNGTGLSATVTALITGTLSGVAQTESVSISGSSPSITFSTKKWTTVTQVTSGTSATGSLTADGVQSNGQAALVESTLGTIKCRIHRRIYGYPLKDQGNVPKEDETCYMIESTVTEGDILTISGVRYVVQNTYRVDNKVEYHHTELFLRRLA